MATNVFSSANSVFVNSEWELGNTPASYTDPFTGETIALVYGINAFSLVNTALAQVPSAEAVFVVGGEISGITYALGTPIVVNDGFTLGIYAGYGDGVGSVENTLIDFRGGTSGGIYGGGSPGSSVLGDVSITVSGGNIRHLCGAGNINIANGNTVGGDIDIEITGGTIESFYGAYSGSVGRDMIITISGGLLTDTAYAGGYNTRVAGGSKVTISDGTIADIMFCGVSGGGTGVGAADGVSVTVTGGLINVLYGGGYGTNSASAAKIGGVDIEFTGGTIGTLIGGGERRATVQGDINISIGGSAYISGDLFGGGGGGVTGDVYITISSDAFINGTVYPGSTSNSYQVQGNSYLTLAGGTVSGSINLAGGVLGSDKIVTVTAHSVVESMFGASEISIESGGFLFCNTGLNNNGSLTLLATNGFNVDVDGTFYNFGDIIVDATGFEMPDNVFQIKLLETNAWNGNKSDISVINYIHEDSRPLGVRIIGTSLYLVDPASIIFVNSEWLEGTTPNFYEDPFTEEVTDLEFGRNAFTSIYDGQTQDQ